MSRRSDVRIAQTNGKPPTSARSPEPVTTHDPRALSRLDWSALTLLTVVLFTVSLGAGSFPSGPFALMNGVSLSLSFVLVAAAFGIVAWREAKRPVAIGAVPGMAGAAALLGVWGAVSLARSSALYLSLDALAMLWGALLLGGLISRLARDRRAFVVLLLTLIVAGSLAAGIGINQYLTEWKKGFFFYRTFGYFTNPDFLAGYLLLTLPLTLAAFVAATDRLARFGLGVGLALQSAGLLLSGSRAGAAILAFALLIWLVLSGAAQATAGRWKRIGAGLAIIVVMAALASAPTLSRFVPGAAGTGQSQVSAEQAEAVKQTEISIAVQQHSGSFRRYTWMGTVNMVKANPIFGTGLGTFTVAYPRYAITAYTAHAHNAYLQWTGDLGIPGLLFLLAVLASATAFAAYVLFLQRRRELDEDDAPPPPSEPARGLAGLFDAPALLLAGLLASAAASLAHNLIDSDGYIAAIAFTLSAVFALMVAQARDMAPLATQTPRPLARGMALAGVLVAVFLVWRGGATAIARVQSGAGEAAMQDQRGAEALAAFRGAASADLFDPEPRLNLAAISQAIQRQDEALEWLQSAARVAPTGRAFYRLGQFYVRQNDLPNALAAFENARAREPHNLQNLRVYADTLRRAGQTDRAEQIYQTMVAMESQPYGTVRAMPHRVETDFAYAHAGLADLAAEAGRWPDAAAEYEKAVGVLKEFWLWFRLDPDIRGTTPPDKANTLMDFYDTTLTRWQEALTRQGADKTEDARKAAEAQAAFRKERDEENRKNEQAGVMGGALTP